MNCRQVQDHLIAARDVPLPDDVARQVSAHTAACPECQALQAQLAAVYTHLQETAARVQVPDAQTEWHAVRRRLRQQSGTAKSAAPLWSRLLRVAAPLTAVAAVALVVMQNRGPIRTESIDVAAPLARQAAKVASDETTADWPEMEQHFAFAAHAEFVETANEEASPFVYVDDESGWLIVWASDPDDAASI
ncbi:anti-sigma factor family protein [Actomonas aquatica]|uniref:Zinc-finger domain-containing protein n=1 Tax=Actomonas aquatica TaxID=2866162 RepID=A0ABZ1C6P2_9BACT|nr:hypothetical protein [Opitutus sp. WL0086]WRQ87063.1 hypothetical protein K1X11_019790 [Opitutus sp. WL0086]